MSTSTSVTELKINKLTKAQYDGIASPSNTELYFVKDEAIDYEDLINTPDFAEVAFSGDYYDLTNRPVIPAAQVNADWNASFGISQILNKPELSTVATTGNYNDLVGKPSITSSVVSGSSSLLTSGGAYSNLVSNVVAGSTANKINVVKAGTTSTITINNVENATTATKLGSTSVGTNVRPIYLNNGVPTQISYTIQKSVPSDAKFTDTTYSVFTGATASAAGTSGLVKAPVAGDQNKFLSGDGNWKNVPLEIEWATYNSTTFSQIETWQSQNKLVLMHYNGDLYELVKSTPTRHYFTGIDYSGKALKRVVFSDADGWSSETFIPQSQLPAGTAGQVITYTGTAGSVTATTLATVATSGSYADLSNKPTINDLTTNEQQLAINSGITSTKVTNYDTHIGDTTIHVTSSDKTNWNDHIADTTIHVTSTDKTNWDNHITDTDVHVTTTDKSNWNNKVDKVSTANKVYGTNSSSAQTTYTIASAATASTIAYRGTGGVLQVGTPTANSHATTKAYVDNLVSTDYALQIIDY